MSQETSSQDTAFTKEITTPSNTAVSIGIPRVRTLRKRNSLKPRKSLLKVKSLRPTKAILGKIQEGQE